MTDEKMINERIENMQAEIAMLKKQNVELASTCEQLQKEIVRVEAGKDVCFESLDKQVKMNRGKIALILLAVSIALMFLMYMASVNGMKTLTIFIAVMIMILCGAAVYQTTADIAEFFSGLFKKKR